MGVTTLLFASRGGEFLFGTPTAVSDRLLSPPLPLNKQHCDSKNPTTLNRPVQKQTFLNGEIHDWYRIILGYSDHLVGKLIDQFNLSNGDRVLDPFCGTGTTLVECMKRGIESVGIDANPSSLFAARVKTRWGLKSERLRELLADLRLMYEWCLEDRRTTRADPTYRYMYRVGMVERGWINPAALEKVVALKSAIRLVHAPKGYADLLKLALTAELVGGASNVKFGPELYCGPPRTRVDVFANFATRVERIATDLDVVAKLQPPPVRILAGDSRVCRSVLRGAQAGSFSAVITSPPYPTEHDYTRNSRLELALWEHVTDTESLRAIKRTMIRSHTKGIYKTDNDSKHVVNHKLLAPIIQAIDARAQTKSHGFAGLYSTVVVEYFGGMYRHLSSLRHVLRRGARCAYIVGDQSSYLQIAIPTAKVLSSLATSLGYEVEGVEQWRTRWSTKTSTAISENILLFRWP